jgi:hypothetical protein
MTPSTRVWGSVALLAAAVAAMMASLVRSDQAAPRAPTLEPRDPLPPPFVVYRTLDHDTYGRIALLPLSSASAAPVVTRLSCVRVHYAGHRGICIVRESDSAQPRYAAYVFDRWLGRQRRIGLSGLPTRVRVAPNGRVASLTTYAEEGTPDGERLAVHTAIVDLAAARVIVDVRDFTIDHAAFPAPRGPVDVTGVAFAPDSDRLFASLVTESERYLAIGALSDRRLRVVRTGVANEAVSPDGQRLIVKKAGAHGHWQLAVLELSTWMDRNLPHGDRSIDDQVEWLDDHHVVYHDGDGAGTSLWRLAVDGTRGPEILVRNGYSAAVQR